jgi:hypothetical protein
MRNPLYAAEAKKLLASGDPAEDERPWTMPHPLWSAG